jgi:predicted metal-binding membrane protein
MASIQSINCVSYNMHGFNQGFSTIRDLCLKQVKPDLFLLQEHWLIE